MITRRQFLFGSIAGGAAVATGYWPDDGLLNRCLDPAQLDGSSSDLLAAAWEGLDAAQVWDCHVHLIGVGDDGSGIWINPAMASLRHPIQSLQKQFYLNASCTGKSGHVDSDFVARLLGFKAGLKSGSKLLLLAFDYHYDAQGQRQPQLSSFHTPNRYAAALAQRHPDHFHWIASIHPYRRDALEELERAIAAGARAVKWLPPAMGMDPASPLCDPFYEVLARHRLPLLTHAGHEQAVQGGDSQDFGNPLRLRRPLDHGVPVIVAHCASLGRGVDLDRGSDGAPLDNFALFSRLMDEPRYEGKLFGDISAITQLNRIGTPLATLLQRKEWHGRLLNGSDYPLPGVMPLFSARELAKRGYLDSRLVAPISALRPHNPLLYDFVLKRNLTLGGSAFADTIFETGRTLSAIRDGGNHQQEQSS